MSWGRGWEVGIRKAIWEHERARGIAAEILAQECGTKHERGARPDLCPICQVRGDSRTAAEGVSPASGEGESPA